MFSDNFPIRRYSIFSILELAETHSKFVPGAILLDKPISSIPKRFGGNSVLQLLFGKNVESLLQLPSGLVKSPSNCTNAWLNLSNARHDLTNSMFERLGPRFDPKKFLLAMDEPGAPAAGSPDDSDADSNETNATDVSLA